MGRIFSALALLCSLCIILMTVASAQTACDAERLCANGLCCSKWGYCGTTSDYCCDGCQSQCNCNIPPPPPYTPPPPPSPPPPPRAPTPSGDGVGTIITEELFDKMLLHRATSPCVGGFYTYDAFLAAANKYPTFGMNGSLENRTRELAAFFAQTAHETTGGWDSAPDGRYSWGYCWIREGMTVDPSLLPSYCVANDQWPCATGKKYYGRGPIQISYNYNYGLAGDDLSYSLLGNPDQVETDPYIAFETAVWFWMTPQSPKPSCHDVMTGGYTPTAAEEQAGRLPGFGLTTNIINGGLECGASGGNDQENDRVGYYLHFCEMLNVDPGDNLYCRNMQPYGLTKKKHQQTFARAALLSE